jgi:DNA-binding NtrC family response regulator
VLADLVMAKRDGSSLLHALQDQLSTLTFVMMTGHGSVDSAVAAMKAGAYDYCTKPLDPRRLRMLLEQVIARHRTLRHVTRLQRHLQQHGRFGHTVGTSPPIQAVNEVVARTAPTDASVLLWGESGTGKDVVARTIHDLSPRASAPFVAVNCAAIPDGLLESEICGYERGAFTGAVGRREGCFALAHRGTLFLDEMTETAPAIQAKLLRILQERTVRPLGSTVDRAVDVRIIAATNVDPVDALRDGRLREDLFYRISVMTIGLPPLRDRQADVPLLAQAFVSDFVGREGRRVRGFTQEALETLERHTWPGNIRELRNVVERAVILARDEFVTVEDLPDELVHGSAISSTGSVTVSPGMDLKQAERLLIEATLEHTGDNKTRTAKMLGMSVKTLYNKLLTFDGAPDTSGQMPPPVVTHALPETNVADSP